MSALTQTVPHGTASGYNHHRCRCDECRLWNRDQKRSERERARSRSPKLADLKCEAALMKRELVAARRMATYWKHEAEKSRDLCVLWQTRYHMARRGTPINA